MNTEKMAVLPSLRRQNLLAELCVNIKYSVSTRGPSKLTLPSNHSAGLKRSCPPGVFVSLTPGDPLLWSGVIFVRKGTRDSCELCPVGGLHLTTNQDPT